MTDKKPTTYDEWMDAIKDAVASMSACCVEMSDTLHMPVTNELRESTGVWNLPSAGWEYTHADGHKIVAVWVADSGPWKGVAASWLGTWMRVEYGDDKASITVPAKLTGTDKPLRVYTTQYLVRRQDGTFTGMRHLIAAGYRRTRSWGGASNLTPTEVMSMGTPPTLKVTIEHGDVVRVVENPEYVEYRQVDESGVGVHERTTADGYTTTTYIVPEKPKPPQWECVSTSNFPFFDEMVQGRMIVRYRWIGAFRNDDGRTTIEQATASACPWNVGKRYDL